SLSFLKIVQVSAKQKKTPQDFRLLGRTQPILSKDSARRENKKNKAERFAFLIPSRSLSYLKIVQVSAKQKKTPQDLHLHCQAAAYLIKKPAVVKPIGGDGALEARPPSR
ncbi:MAG: hypothetical protein PUB53_04330, partial [Bacteroidales bacterium]|nr:hypothetical protein [Bacteroidales bacterium]